MNRLIKSLSVLGLSLMSYAAFADAAYDMGPYANVSVGGGIYHISDEGFSTNLNIMTFRGGLGYLHSLTSDQNPFYLGAEVNGIIDHVFESDIVDAETGHGFEATAIAGKVLGSSFALYAKGGVQVLGDEGSYSTAPLAGVGLGYQLTQHIRLNVEENNAFYKDGLTSISGSVGVQYSFS
jgi:hypothetical protein